VNEKRETLKDEFKVNLNFYNTNALLKVWHYSVLSCVPIFLKINSQ